MAHLFVSLAMCMLLVPAITGRCAFDVIPRPCCSMLAYEGKFSGVIDVSTGMPGRATKYRTHGEIHSDINSSRLAVTTNVFVDGKWIRRKIITSRNTTYLVMPATKMCIKLPATHIFPSCIPKTAKYLGSKLLNGLQWPNVVVDIWEFADPSHPRLVLRYHVAKTTCVPMKITATWVRQLGAKQIHQHSLYELNAGIANASVFKVPDYCYKKRDFFTEWHAKRHFNKHAYPKRCSFSSE